MEQKTNARDFFLHLGAMIGLYASAIALVNLLFSVVNKAYPQVVQYYYYTVSNQNISFPVATLIIVFPIFIFLSYLLEREYSTNPAKKEIWIRRWSIYITLFVSGIILVSDLVMILYKFLDGQELTTGFILKALIVLAVTALVFGFYIQNIREKIPSWRKKFWVVFTSVIIITSIILGFSIIGSPRAQRLMRYDYQKTTDLQNIQWQVVNFYQRTGSLPNSLNEINDPISNYIIPTDQQTDEPYEYKKTGNLSFELCASFNRESTTKSGKSNAMSETISVDTYYGKNENWEHDAGRHCFARAIDPNIYPVYPEAQIKRGM